MTKVTIATVAVLALAAWAYSKAEEAKKADAPAKASSKVAAAEPAPKDAQSDDPEKVDWKKVDWKSRLTSLQYDITREAGTERQFHNEYWDNFKQGSYKCVSCGLPLFESTAKFDAGCGWPSFDKAVAKDAVTEHVDRKMLSARTEVRCRRCGAHLGHVFDDGPTKTKLRYCMNSASMKFVPAKDAVTKNASKDASAKDKPVEKKAEVKSAEATQSTDTVDAKK